MRNCRRLVLNDVCESLGAVTRRNPDGGAVGNVVVEVGGDGMIETGDKKACPREIT